MDADFINVYVSKQKALIDDMQSRLLLSETKLTVTEVKLKQAADTIEQLKVQLQEMDALRNKVNDYEREAQAAKRSKMQRKEAREEIQTVSLPPNSEHYEGQTF